MLSKWQKITWREKILLTNFKVEIGVEEGWVCLAETVIAQACRDAVRKTEVQLELEQARDVEDNKRKVSSARKASVSRLVQKKTQKKQHPQNILHSPLSPHHYYLLLFNNNRSR